MLFCSQHKDCEHKLRCEEHFDEDTLSLVCSTTEGSCDCQWAWEEGIDDSSSCHASEHLGNEDESATREGYGTDETEAKSDLERQVRMFGERMMAWS